MDPRFGRGAYFLIVDPDTMEWYAVQNPALSASGGAGIQAAQYMIDQKCDAVISGEFGPNAYHVLNAAGIATYSSGDCSTVIEAVQRFKSGEIELLPTPASKGRLHR